MPETPTGGRHRSAWLALAAAYVDTCGFIGLFGLFTAHVTGNFVLIGGELVSRHGDVIAKLVALPVFLVSVVLTAQTEVALQRRGMHATAWLLGAEAVLIGAAGAAYVAVGGPHHADDRAVMTIGFLLISAMGIQNALMRTSLAGPVQTTVMTGNVTQMAIDLLSVASGRADISTHTRLRRSWPAIAAFAVGSALGAAGFAAMNFHCLWPAAALVLGVAITEGTTPSQSNWQAPPA